MKSGREESLLKMVKFKDSDGRAQNQALSLLSVGSLCPAKQHAQRPRAATSEPWSTALGMLTRPPTGGRACKCPFYR